MLAIAAGACGGVEHSDIATGGIPAGFVDEVVVRVPAPTDFAFTPDGRTLIALKSGTVRIARGRTLVAEPALVLDQQVCTERERGLTGIAVDPNFARTRFVYVYYTFARLGECPVDVVHGPVNRLVRYVLGPDDRLDPRSATVLLDNILSYHAIHNGGALEFGRDGLLYVGVGDGGHDYARRTRRSGENAAARDLHVLLGKVLRITPAGGVPATNPFVASGAVACRKSGRTTPGRICAEIFAWGLRNPFRLAMDPGAEGVRFFINDVGQNVWEEIDVGRTGADYGWNLREGPCPRGVRVRCPRAVPTMEDPLYAYGHDGCASITGGAFVPRGVWPAAYDGSYLFADFVCGKIFRLSPDGSKWRKSVFALTPTPVTLRFGPPGAPGALYYATFARGGEIRRLIRGRST